MIGYKMRRALLGAAGGVLLAFAAGSGGPPAAAAGSAEIKIQNFAFVPAALTVAPGTTVTWTSNDEEPHNIVSIDQPRRFRSLAIEEGDKFTFRL
jgi:plastocyanin